MAKVTRKRPYTKHGQVALNKALKTVSNGDGWIDDLGEVGEALKTWKAALVNDLGGEGEVSAMPRAVIELATKTHLMLESVDRFLLEQPSLVNKSRRQLFAVVTQRQALADSLSRYMGQLGLAKRAKQPVSLADYLNAKRDDAKPS